MKLDYISLFIAAILTVAVGQTLEETTTHIARFLHGILVGTSIGCSVLELVLYTRSPKNK